MPNLSSVLTPMTSTLKLGKDFHWTSECQNAFEEIKQILSYSSFDLLRSIKKLH